MAELPGARLVLSPCGRSCVPFGQALPVAVFQRGCRRLRPLSAALPRLVESDLEPKWDRDESYTRFKSTIVHEIDKKRGGRRWPPPLVVYEIGMFSLGFPEVLPPTIIMTMHIRSILYIHPFAPHDYSVPYSSDLVALYESLASRSGSSP